MKPAEPGSWIEAAWPAVPGVRAGITTRRGGVSRGPYASFNLATHVGDDGDAVRENRERLAALLDLPAPPCWLAQRHGREVAVLPGAAGAEADAAYTRTPGAVCAVLVADCIPLLLAAADGTEVAAVHAGWRGLAAGVIEAALAHFRAPPPDIRAWIGPHISADCYPVGEDMRAACLGADPGAESAFRPAGPGRWLADLTLMATLRLERHGVTDIHASGCTFSEPHLYYSHRRDGACGRMAALIWING